MLSHLTCTTSIQFKLTGLEKEKIFFFFNISFCGYSCIWMTCDFQDLGNNYFHISTVWCPVHTDFNFVFWTISNTVTGSLLSLQMHHFHQAERTRRSHPEEEGHVVIKGSTGRTTPAVAASEKRKSLKLVREDRGEKARGEKSRQKGRWDKKKGIIFSFPAEYP